MRYAGIDYGMKRIGISLSDESGKMAFPFSVIENKKGVVGRVTSLLKDNKVEYVVIGESLDLKNKPNPLMKHISLFAEALEKESGITISFMREFFTSHQAQKIQGKNSLIDASAATIILQSYLDSL